MIAAILALAALNVATMLVAARREARLLDALMARNGAEYALIKRSDAPKDKPKRVESFDDAPPELVHPIGL